VNPGDFATVEGQIVKIIDKRMISHQSHAINCASSWIYKIKLMNDNLTHWINGRKITPLESQKAPKILYGA